MDKDRAETQGAGLSSTVWCVCVNVSMCQTGSSPVESGEWRERWVCLCRYGHGGKAGEVWGRIDVALCIHSPKLGGEKRIWSLGGLFG